MNRPSTSRRAQPAGMSAPAESFLFEVADLGSSHQDIAWSGGESVAGVRNYDSNMQSAVIGER